MTDDDLFVPGFDPMEHWACGRTKRDARRNHRLINRAARIASRKRLVAPYGGRRSADDWRRTLRHMTGCCYPDQRAAVALASRIVRGAV